LYLLNRKYRKKMVPEAGLEPAHSYKRGILNPLCLPIPPLGHRELFYSRDWDPTLIVITVIFGAANETRTRDIHVGNVMLYQLSYSRFVFFTIHPTDINQSWYPRPDLNRHTLTSEGF
jgi:hypothetical protein